MSFQGPLVVLNWFCYVKNEFLLFKKVTVLLSGQHKVIISANNLSRLFGRERYFSLFQFDLGILFLWLTQTGKNIIWNWLKCSWKAAILAIMIHFTRPILNLKNAFWIQILFSVSFQVQTGEVQISVIFTRNFGMRLFWMPTISWNF